MGTLFPDQSLNDEASDDFTKSNSATSSLTEDTGKSLDCPDTSKASEECVTISTSKLQEDHSERRDSREESDGVKLMESVFDDEFQDDALVATKDPLQMLEDAIISMEELTGNCLKCPAPKQATTGEEELVLKDQSYYLQSVIASAKLAIVEVGLLLHRLDAVLNAANSEKTQRPLKNRMRRTNGLSSTNRNNDPI